MISFCCSEIMLRTTIVTSCFTNSQSLFGNLYMCVLIALIILNMSVCEMDDLSYPKCEPRDKIFIIFIGMSTCDRFHLVDFIWLFSFGIILSYMIQIFPFHKNVEIFNKSMLAKKYDINIKLRILYAY